MQNNDYTVKVSKELESLIPGFLTNRKKDLDQLKEALKNKDFKTIQTIGHRMKGTCSSYGFTTFSTIGATLESAVKTQNEKEIEPSITQFELHLTNLKILYIDEPSMQ